MRSLLRSWKSLGLVTASTGTSAAVTLIVTVVAVGLLEKAEYGDFIFFVAASTFIGTFFDLGVTLHMTMEHSAGPPDERAAVASRHWSAQLWSYGGGAILAIALSIPAGRYFGVPDGIVALAALNGAFLGLFNFVTGLFQVRQEWVPRARVILRQAVLRGPATLVGLALGSATTGAVGAVVGAGVGLLLAMRDPVLSSIRDRFRTVTGVVDAGRIWAQSRWFTILTAAASLAQYLPVAWVGRVSGSETLASFGLASQLAAGPALILLSVLIYQQPTGSDPTVSLGDYAALAKRSIAPILVLFVIAAVAAPFLIPAIFGAEFESAVVPFELLLVGTGVLTLASPLDILNLRLRNPRGWAVMDGVRVVTLIVGLIVFPRMLSVPVAAGAAVAGSAVLSRIVGLAGLLRVRHRLFEPADRT